MAQSINIIEQRITAGGQFDGATGASTGSITTVAGGSLIAGEAFFLKDGKGAEVEFRFVDSAVGFPISEKLRPVPFLSGDTADQIRDKIIAAINATRSLNLLASNGGAATVNLVNRVDGAFGNVTPTTDTVANAGFVVSAMTGGAERPFTDIDGTRYYDPAADGGQFDFPFAIPQSIPQGEPARGGVQTWEVTRVVLTGDATAHTVDLLTADGAVVQLASGSGGNVVEGPFTLAGDERLRVTTTGGTGVKAARVLARPAIPLPSSAF